MPNLPGLGLRELRLLALAATCAALLAGAVVRAEEPASLPPAGPAAGPSSQDLLGQIEELRQQINQLQARQAQPGIPTTSPVVPPKTNGADGDVPASDARPTSNGSAGLSREDTADPGAGLPGGEGPAVPGSGDNFPMKLSYRYNAGGGYTSLSTRDGDFSVNLQNLLALDGTFYNKASVNTTEKGFNLPFSRNYLFGNITKDVDYQIAFQESLGSFNVLDMWGNLRVCDPLNIRVGRMVTPFEYEYYIIWPGWGPVATLSPVFQIAGRRREGAMAWGRLFGNKIQYQQGIFNASDGAFYDIGNGVSYTGSLDVTPFKGSNDLLDSLGVGVSVETSHRSYSLAAGATDNFVTGAGEPSTNNIYFGSTGVPFFAYVPTMFTSGTQTRVAPHLYWYGQFSVLAEWAYSQRHLTDTGTGVQALEQVNGYYVTLSYFLTGERYTGDGLSGFSAIAPNRPFSFRDHQQGIGAWELGFQYAQLHLNPNVVSAGFADPLINATQLNQMMVGINWYMNKYTKISFDWLDARTNKPVPLGSNGTLSNTYDVFWTRLALMF